jgi:hypothetical protein
VANQVSEPIGWVAGTMDKNRNQEHLRLIGQIMKAHDSAGIKVWLLGGWGIDALCGLVRRAHHDIDLILQLSNRATHRRLVGEIADSVPEDAPQKLRSLIGGVQCDTRFFHVLPDGMLVSDFDATDPLLYPWPPDSFPDQVNGQLSGGAVRAISWSAQFVAKAGFSAFQKGVTLRPKDKIDLALIGKHLPPGASHALQSWFPGIPKHEARAQPPVADPPLA